MPIPAARPSGPTMSNAEALYNALCEAFAKQYVQFTICTPEVNLFGVNIEARDMRGGILWQLFVPGNMPFGRVCVMIRALQQAAS